MTVAEMEAIVGGYHGDPFNILGPHRIQKARGTERWEVRAFLPQAESAQAIVGEQSILMEKKDPQGFFCARIDGEPRLYRLRAVAPGGNAMEFEDPYRFPPLLSGFDLHLHGEGTHYETYKMLGSHLIECEGVPGVRFAVWAPNAEIVSVVGDFNGWDSRRHPMRLRTGGIWELFFPNLAEGASYKYHVRSKFRGFQEQKADPYASRARNVRRKRRRSFGSWISINGRTRHGWRRAPRRMR